MMAKKIKLEAIALNESVLKMSLNADNRTRFTNVILEDTFLERSNSIRADMRVLMHKFEELSWGKTPKQHTDNMKLSASVDKLKATAEAKGLDHTLRIGRNTETIVVNMGGPVYTLGYDQREDVICNFNYEFIGYPGSNERSEFHIGCERVDVDSNHKLVKEFDKLKDEASDLEEASQVLKAMLNTVFGKSRTLGKAVEQWPELTSYAPSILSACREMTINGPDLNAKIQALREGKMSAKDAMNATAKAKK